MNNTIVTGRIGKDAEIKTFDGGRAVINFSLAWSEKYKDRQGEQQERTVWYDCAVWRKEGATGVAAYLKKGAQVLVQGEVSGRGWQNDAGEIKVSLQINVRDLEILQYVKDDGQQSSGYQQQQQRSAPAYQPPQYSAPAAAANAGANQDFFKSDESDDLLF